MITWFRKKTGVGHGGPTFPSGYTDLHCHLLPGLDDGAPDPETALDLLGQMVELGIRHFTCTPHVMEGMWMNNTRKILQTLQDFSPLVEERFGTTVALQAAAEYMIDDGFNPLIRKEDLLPLYDNLILVELSFVAPPIQLFTTLAEMQVAGYRPVLAHPERYFFYHNDLDAYQHLKDAGCLFQLNLLSLSNYYGKDVRLCAEKLLKLGMYDLTGTDLHHDRHAQQLTKMVSTGTFGARVQNLMERQVVK